MSITDLSHTGDIKPSGERGVHAEIYKAHPEVQFVIHTHQDNASIAAATDVDAIPVSDAYPELGKLVLNAEYGLPGMKKIREAVGKATRQSTGNAVIMRNHGAVCYGKDADEAFQAALDLEDVCWEAVVDGYEPGAKPDEVDEEAMRQAALVAIAQSYQGKRLKLPRGPHAASERTDGGFVLHEGGGSQVYLLDQPKESMSPEALLHLAIYKKHKRIGYIVPADAPDVVAVSRANVTMDPLIDDFAQIVGPQVKTAFTVGEAAGALRDSAAVLLPGGGALCVGATEDDAAAVATIVEKNSKALLYGPFLGELEPISMLDRLLMRVVYQMSYSRRIDSNV